MKYEEEPKTKKKKVAHKKQVVTEKKEGGGVSGEVSLSFHVSLLTRSSGFSQTIHLALLPRNVSATVG